MRSTRRIIGINGWLIQDSHTVQAPIYLLVETSGSNAEHDTAKLDAFLEDALGCDRMAHQLSGRCRPVAPALSAFFTCLLGLCLSPLLTTVPSSCSTVADTEACGYAHPAIVLAGCDTPWPYP